MCFRGELRDENPLLLLAAALSGTLLSRLFLGRLDSCFFRGFKSSWESRRAKSWVRRLLERRLTKSLLLLATRLRVSSQNWPLPLSFQWLQNIFLLPPLLSDAHGSSGWVRRRWRGGSGMVRRRRHGGSLASSSFDGQRRQRRRWQRGRQRRRDLSSAEVGFPSSSSSSSLLSGNGDGIGRPEWGNAGSKGLGSSFSFFSFFCFCGLSYFSL